MTISHDEGRRQSRHEDRGVALVVEGAPPGAGRPSWVALAIATVAALALGSAVGYGVAASPGATSTPIPAGTATPSAVASSTVAALPSGPAEPMMTQGPVFAAAPCERLTGVPFAMLPGGFSTISTYQSEPPVLPGVLDCSLFDGQGRLVATLSLRQAPTTLDEVAVVVAEVFQGDEVSEVTFGTDPVFLIPCSHHWPFCHPAAVVLHAPYLAVVSLQPGAGDLQAARALATTLVRLLFP